MLKPTQNALCSKGPIYQQTSKAIKIRSRVTYLTGHTRLQFIRNMYLEHTMISWRKALLGNQAFGRKIPGSITMMTSAYTNPSFHKISRQL